MIISENIKAYGVLGLSLSLGLVLSAFVASSAVKDMKSANQNIGVKGYAEKTIQSDLGTWQGNLIVSGTTLSDAYAKLESQRAKVTRFIVGEGFTADMAKAANVRIQIINKTIGGRTDYNQIAGYRLEQIISLSSGDIEKIKKTSQDSSELLQQGVMFQAENPSFFYTKLDSLKVEMLGLAAVDARARADQLAKSSGSRVGSLRSAEQGVFQITAPHSTDVSGYGVYDTSSVEKSIKAIVTMTYSVSL